MDKQLLIEQHNFASELKFRLKASMLKLRRGLQNSFSPVKQFPKTNQLVNQPIIAFSESELWNASDNDQNWMLTAGKIENLRIAYRKLNGLEVKAGEVFSFWKHIGNPNFGKGYVIGREIREGCIVPTIAGGLCQLSNALYDAALKAGFEIVERHKHTRVIKGSLAEQDRDATVKWNYIDLRFKSNRDFRIEIVLTAEKMLVLFKSDEKGNADAAVEAKKIQPSHKLNDCYSCGNISCFKHPGATPVRQEKTITAFILDERWIEYDEYVQSIASEKDHFILPLKKNAFIKTNRYEWSIKNSKNIKTTTLAALKRALAVRFAGKKNVFSLSLEQDRKIAAKMAKLVPIDCTHVVVSQNLLPFLWEQGVFGGRTFEVLMTRLPMQKIHDRLDFAHKLYPSSETLNDFRAPKRLIELENTALTKASKIITPHTEIAEAFKNKCVLLDWKIPVIKNIPAQKGTKILFPASALGRKGAYEMKKLAWELNLTLVVAGKVNEKENFWGNIKTEPFSGNLDEIGLIIYPAHIEHQPRLLLRAIARGIPVVASTACGLKESENVNLFPANNYLKLKEAVQNRLKPEGKTVII